MDKEEKQAELEKYRDLVLATLDYYLDKKEMHTKSANFDFVEHFKGLKIQTEDHYHRGRLSKLKQWFRDMTEGHIEARDLKFNKYLQEKTNYDVNIFSAYIQRVEKLIEKGKITTNNQFYDINILVDQLSQNEPVNQIKIEILNQLLRQYENTNHER